MAKAYQHGSDSIRQQEHADHEFLLHGGMQTNKHAKTEQFQVRHVRSYILHRMQTELSSRPDLSVSKGGR